MRLKAVFLGLAAAVTFCAGRVAAQDAPSAKAATPATTPSGLQTGPATVAPHWSRNKYPESVPEGATYYIVVKGDTLWDLSKRFLANPYLWPQIWDQNKYITDAHWIYPGDPLVLPKVAVVAEQAGQPGAPGGPEGAPGAEGQPQVPGAEGAAPGQAALPLGPITEETTMQCAAYVVSESEDQSLRVIGSEQGNAQVAFGDRDILYLNKGSNSGVKAGDIYSLHHPSYVVKHPSTGKSLGTKIDTTGWVQVILVQEDASIAVVEQACQDIHAGDYLKPFEKVNVPLVLARPPASRLTPPSGKLDQYIVDLAGDVMIAGSGHLVTIDAGSESGVAPGNVFVVYRVMYPSVPTPRAVIGELTVVAVRDKTATAKVTYSSDAIMVGDRVELR